MSQNPNLRKLFQMFKNIKTALGPRAVGLQPRFRRTSSFHGGTRRSVTSEENSFKVPSGINAVRCRIQRAPKPPTPGKIIGKTETAQGRSDRPARRVRGRPLGASGDKPANAHQARVSRRTGDSSRGHRQTRSTGLQPRTCRSLGSSSELTHSPGPRARDRHSSKGTSHPRAQHEAGGPADRREAPRRDEQAPEKSEVCESVGI